MKSTLGYLGIVALLTFGFCSESWSQRPDGGGRGAREEGRGPEGRGPRRDREGLGERREGRGSLGGRPANPIMAALDTDRDGELSQSEIENAVIALKKLDRNNDGKLAGDEIRPRGPRGGRFGGEFREGGRLGGQGGPGLGGGRGFGGNPQAFVDRMLENDKDKDGKVTRDELPERWQRMLEFADQNNDGALDKSELEAMSQRFGRRGRGGFGGRGGREGGDRPRRPQRPEFD